MGPSRRRRPYFWPFEHNNHRVGPMSPPDFPLDSARDAWCLPAGAGGEPHFDCRSRSSRLVPLLNLAVSVEALWYLSGRPSAYSSSILGPSRTFLPVGLPQWTSTRYSLPGLGPRWAGMENFPFAIASPEVRAFSSRGISAKLPIPMGLPSTITVPSTATRSSPPAQPETTSRPVQTSNGQRNRARNSRHRCLSRFDVPTVGKPSGLWFMVINPLTGRFRLGMKPEHALKSERTGPLSPWGRGE